MAAYRVSVWIAAALAVRAAAAAPAPAPAPADLPARVIASTPGAFATNVDPGLKQVTFTFDRPMNAESKGGIGIVRFAGIGPWQRQPQPTWDAAGTVMTLPVELQPDVTYAVGINDTMSRGIVDAAGVPALGFYLLFSTGPRTTDDLPARVVQTEPADGAKDVDPALKQITVTFSRPIAPGDYSWVIYRGSGAYPGKELPQLSADRLSATLPVSLKPDTVYALGINDPTHSGYKDTKGRPVFPYAICFKTAK